jgi:anaerobic magnesium-protoporphyrin IX monomethyl ester cyclase
MKILVVNPPAFNKKDFIREGRCMQTKSSWAALWMPLSLCYISAVLRNEGHEIRLIDCIAEKLDNKKLLDISRAFKPDLAVINTAIPSVVGDLHTASVLKESISGIRIVIVGMYPTLFEKEALQKFMQVDYAIMDEPEWVISHLVKSLSGYGPLAAVRGLIYRGSDEIIVNERQVLSANNLDDLPFPARDLLNNDAYRLPMTGKKFTLLSVGRGCSGNCIYCIANIYYGTRFRKRSVASVISEIEECVHKYDIHNFLFWGESFTTDQNYGEEICDEIIKRNIEITWSTTSRVDTLNRSLLDKMKKAGCVLLGLGIESYDQTVLDNARKGVTTGQIDQAVSMVHQAGIKSMGHFVFGLPGETKETVLKSIKFACRNVDFAQFYCAIPYPKTELEKIGRRQGWISKFDYEQFDLARSGMGNEFLSAKEIKKIRDRAYRRFYFRPEMLIRAMGEIGSLKSLFSALNFLNWIKPGK